MPENLIYDSFIGDDLTPEQEYAIFYHDSLNTAECSLRGCGEAMGEHAVKFLEENGMTFLEKQV